MKAGVDKSTVSIIYCSLVRSVIEYAAQLYHHPMNSSQNEKIERLQRIMLKCIYGFITTYKEALKKSGLMSLEERRRDLCRKFALKTAENPRYEHWFPLRRRPDYDLRKERKYEEEFAATERRRKSPLLCMRRLLNEIA